MENIEKGMMLEVFTRVWSINVSSSRFSPTCIVKAPNKDMRRVLSCNSYKDTLSVHYLTDSDLGVYINHAQ